ncbi:helix-turn-helix transcriptional regulator [Streptomyces sp. HNM0574]|uniref:response regulator transcription factor n=1 Tax=Streptomyces sp. HNM0574 TaxID=2714954 RepID=UPI00146A1D3B|nr:helix-turn-helix transcriptional regulator [Streptomyces sp. HNM0574]NLU68437.1 helix-turn-helix transcriptional regulator [Streptomyces sp. HNM0574]
MRARDGLSRLTRRELSVLELLGRGLANREIARSLGLRPTTVKDHIRAVYTKCGVQNRVEAALLAHGIPVPPLPDGPVPRGSEAPPATPCLCRRGPARSHPYGMSAPYPSPSSSRAR